MGDGVVEGDRALARPWTLADRTRAVDLRALTTAEVAWIAVVPTVIVVLLAIWLLAPTVGNVFFVPAPARFWSRFQLEVRPEPTEEGRYVLALAAPLLLSSLVILGRRALHVSVALRVLVLAVQAVVVAFSLAALLEQQSEIFGSLYPPALFEPWLIDYFSTRTLLVAAAGTVVVVALCRHQTLRPWIVGAMRETRIRAWVAGCLAAAAIVLWLSHALNTEHTIGFAVIDVSYHLGFTMDETYAVLDGRSPLVDFAAQYGSLWPYVFAAGMSVLGTTIGVWVVLALTATGLGMAAIFALLRRVAHSSILGLLLFLPVLASAFFKLQGTLENRYTFANYFGTFPMRYAGPSILAWLVTRHLSGDRPRHAWPLFVVAGLVILNNIDVGAPALGATVAALLWGLAWSRTDLRRLAIEAVAGLAGAYAVVCTLTLVRAGALPDLGMLTRFARLFGAQGFGLYPMPAFGLHLVMLVTFVAAIVVATVRTLDRSPDRVLTGMLAWAGVFGLGASAYFVGRSTPENLTAVFFPWALALALLAIPAVRTIASASWREPPIAATGCVALLLVLACTLAQTPTPWSQLHRLRDGTTPILARPIGQDFIARETRPGESVAILGVLGHKIGTTLGIDNVSIYTNGLSMPTVEQLDETIVALRRAGGNKLFLSADLTDVEQQAALTRDGFAFVEEDSGQTTAMWVDRTAR